jgi:predicted DNA-binding transcriptional regulator AlpA
MVSRVKLPRLVSAGEIAVMLGVSRQRVSQLTAKPDFPPGQRLRAGTIWAYDDVAEWAQLTGRPVNPIPDL